MGKHQEEIKFTDVRKLLKGDETELKIVVHDRKFHADDVLCISLLKLVSKCPLHVIRTRDKEEIEQFSPHILLDEEYKGNNKNILIFDHHTASSYDWYDNGIKKASIGKLAEFLIEDKKFLEYLRYFCLYEVELRDNCQNPDTVKNYTFTSSPLGFIKMANPTKEDVEKYGNEIQDLAFYDAVFSTINILKDIINHYYSYIRQTTSIGTTEIYENILINDIDPESDSIRFYNSISSDSKDKIKVVIYKHKNSDGEIEYKVYPTPANIVRDWNIIISPVWNKKQVTQFFKERGINSYIKTKLPNIRFVPEKMVFGDLKDAIKAAKLLMKK